MTYTRPGEKVAAERAAKALDAAVRRYGFTASEEKLAGRFYVVTQDREGVRRAYQAADIDVAAVSAKDWDYAAWRVAFKPDKDRDRDAAVWSFVKHGRDLSGDDGQPLLEPEEREVLTLLKEGKPLGSNLTERQKAVLETAEKLGLVPVE